MKRAVVCAIVLLTIAGCSLNRTFVEQVNRNWELIGPEYTAYIAADESLSEESKAIRMRTAETFTALIEEAMKDE